MDGEGDLSDMGLRYSCRERNTVYSRSGAERREVDRAIEDDTARILKAVKTLSGEHCTVDIENRGIEIAWLLNILVF